MPPDLSAIRCKRRATYTAAMVRDLLHRIGAPVAPRRSLATRLEGREPGELTIGEVATRLGAPRNTVHRWIARGVVAARLVPVLTHSLWLIRADEAELDHLRQRRQHGVGHPTTPLTLETHHAGQISKGSRVLYVHLGGAPALNAYHKAVA